MLKSISAFLFILSLGLAVAWGGQTIDYSWGPALVALASSMTFLLLARPDRSRPGSWEWLAIILLLIISGMVLSRCWDSPVKAFARADALLLASLLAAFSWIFFSPLEGPSRNVFWAGWSILIVSNLILATLQIREPSLAWPYSSRPAKLPSGMFGHYNHLADFALVTALVFAAKAFLQKNSLAIRFVHLLGAAAGFGCVLISGSRGGLVSLGIGSVVLLFAIALVAWRKRSRHSKLLMMLAIVVPILGALLAVPAINLVQERRGLGSTSLEGLSDNQARLTLMGTAVDLSLTQDWRGGGSRSFGWRKYHEWDKGEQGTWGQRDDNFVHNELLQAAVDYGWPTAGLIVVLVLVIFAAALFGIMFNGSPAPRESIEVLDATMCGGLAAMVGTLVHSNFSFVTHTMPGAMYLGLAMAMALPRKLTPPDQIQVSAMDWGGRIVRSFMIAASVCFGFSGIRASSAFQALWPVWFKREKSAVRFGEDDFYRISHALKVWPDAGIGSKAAAIAGSMSQEASLPASEKRHWLEKSAEYYEIARILNPHDPALAVNSAGVFSAIDRHREAESTYLDAIRLEGGMEAMFRARYYYGTYLYRYWRQKWIYGGLPSEDIAEEALGQFLKARDLLVKAKDDTPVSIWGADGDQVLKELEDTVSFLEAAKIVPRTPNSGF